MADLPWSGRGSMEPGHTYVAMASHLPLTRLSATVTFVVAVRAIRRQLADVDGLIGYALRAKPLNRDYWTLSVWRDESSLGAFVKSSPHAELMRSLKPTIGPTKFVQWEISSADGRPSWTAAIERLTST
ncbi:MAG TPA: antibiotic biosynthesis monooxygenase [Candidatus Acidoferrum sp.]|nr:antibiotic biosynthesis monooxygenase [Candidatus Acidoferrum sp.]